MALFKSDRLTSASGSVGGTTYSHNRFGLYTRARRVPVNPNTTSQQRARNAFSASSADWRSLTDAQRAAWNAYAAASPVANALGDSVTLTGAMAYTSQNSFTNQVGLGSFADAPTTPGRVPLGLPSIVIDDSTNGATITDFAADILDTTTIALFLGSPVSAGVSFFKGPYQLVGSGTPTTGTLVLAGLVGRNGLPLVAGQRVPYRIAGADVTGRLTTVATGITTVFA